MQLCSYAKSIYCLCTHISLLKQTCVTFLSMILHIQHEISHAIALHSSMANKSQDVGFLKWVSLSLYGHLWPSLTLKITNKDSSHKYSYDPQ